MRASVHAWRWPGGWAGGSACMRSCIRACVHVWQDRLLGGLFGTIKDIAEIQKCLSFEGEDDFP